MMTLVLPPFLLFFLSSLGGCYAKQITVSDGPLVSLWDKVFDFHTNALSAY